MASPHNPSPLDQVVKGAPPPNMSVNEVATAALGRHGGHLSEQQMGHNPQSTSHHMGNQPTPAQIASSLKTPRPPHLPPDPTSLLPSSPPQIYLNLLILEASLRSQYLTLRARRRQNTFVLTLLAIWILCFTYLLWLRPRDDGKGIGGSQYWLLDMLQKVGFITGMVTALLFWATGQWERGVRWPRRWVGIANRGLRGFNAKIVILRGPWWSELAGYLSFCLPFSGGLWGGETGGSSYHFINSSQEKHTHLAGDGRTRHRITEDGKEYAEEDIAPGGDYIKVLLLPKPFSPDFREGWEVYRTEYWERENERRAELRKRVRARQREIARAEGGWLWWTGWRGWKRARSGPSSSRPGDVERSASHAHHSSHFGHPARQSSISSSAGGPLRVAERKRRPSALRGRDTSSHSLHSRSSSRSTTPTPSEIEDKVRAWEPGYGISAAPNRERRWSTSTAGSNTTNTTTTTTGTSANPTGTASRSDSRRKRAQGAKGKAGPGRGAPVRLASGQRGAGGVGRSALSYADSVGDVDEGSGGPRGEADDGGDADGEEGSVFPHALSA